MKVRSAIPRSVGRFLGTVAIASQAGCATWHEDTMSAHQLVAADCQALATEEAKLSSNAKNAAQTAYFTAATAVLTAVASGLAGSASGDPSINQNVNQQAESAGNNEKLSNDIEQRARMVRELRTRKGCP